jgi:Concanavalin A-like lectin/glucanases superfamily
LSYVKVTSGATNYVLYLAVSATGNFQILAATVASPNSIVYTTDTGVKVTDGYWHHVGIAKGSNGYLHAYVDGNFYSLTSMSSVASFTANNATIGTTYASTTPTMSAYVDEIVASSTAFTYTELLSRYKAGSMLQVGFPTTASPVLSGDRIAEVLCLAGFGSIVNGQVSLTCNFAIGNSYGLDANLYVPGATTNGAVAVEPYYWNTPIYNSTALDLILQVSDTDIGMFIQEPDGSFTFYDQNYYGTWTWHNTYGTWAPSSAAWANAPALTDDGSGYAYYGPSLKVIRDDADLWTTVKVAPQSGVTQIYENTANEPRWGYSTLTKSGTVHTSLSSALSTANFLGYLFATPLPRVQAVELRSETSNGTSLPVMLSLEPSDVVFFSRDSVNYSSSGTYPSQEGSIVNQPMVVESISHDFVADPGYWHTTFILDPYPVRS